MKKRKPSEPSKQTVISETSEREFVFHCTRTMSRANVQVSSVLGGESAIRAEISTKDEVKGGFTISRATSKGGGNSAYANGDDCTTITIRALDKGTPRYTLYSIFSDLDSKRESPFSFESSVPVTIRAKIINKEKGAPIEIRFQGMIGDSNGKPREIIEVPPNSEVTVIRVANRVIITPKKKSDHAYSVYVTAAIGYTL